MPKRNIVQTTSGEWLFVTPISSLELGKDIGREFTIKRVTFIHRDKLARARKRFGIKKRLSELPNFFKEYVANETLAVVRHTGKPIESARTCLQMVEEEAAILSLSYLGYDKRKYGRAMGISGRHALGGHDYVFFNTRNKSITGSSACRVSLFPIRLDRAWRDYQKLYYLKLLKILNGKIEVFADWRRDLWRAAVLIGRSIGTLETATAFLWNMIALERLLTKGGDKVKEALPERCEAFLGWVGFWKQRRFRERLDDAYAKRCSLVHRGEAAGITKKLLLFTDDLLYNVLLNLVKHIAIFPSKEHVIEFSSKVQAEHLLGVKSKVRPKNLVAISRRYRHRDFEEM